MSSEEYDYQAPVLPEVRPDRQFGGVDIPHFYLDDNGNAYPFDMNLGIPWEVNDRGAVDVRFSEEQAKHVRDRLIEIYGTD